MPKCCATLQVAYAECSRTGVFERRGKWYCKQHDPGDPAENKKRRMQKYAKEETRQVRLELAGHLLTAHGAVIQAAKELARTPLHRPAVTALVQAVGRLVELEAQLAMLPEWSPE